MREVENDPVKSLWQISHMLLLASYLCVWQSSQLSNILRSTVRQKERVPPASNTAPSAVTGVKKYAYKGNVLATYDNSKNRRTAGIPFAKEILTVCAYL